MSDAGPLAFVCTKCSKGFRRKGDLARHALIHDPDAERFHCSFPKCTHSSLQKSNLKVHYISKHLQLRYHRCSFHGCDKAYTDAPALIKHEKLKHRFFRRAHKSYTKKSVKKEEVEPELRALVAATTPSNDYPASNVSTRASTAFPATPAPTTSLPFGAPFPGPPAFNWSNPFGPQTQIVDASSRASTAFHATPSFGMPPPGPPSFNWSNPFGPQTQPVDSFLHEMVPDLFPNPVLYGNHSGSFAIPNSNARLSYTYPLLSFPQYNLPMPNSAEFMIPNVPQIY